MIFGVTQVKWISQNDDVDGQAKQSQVKVVVLIKGSKHYQMFLF